MIALTITPENRPGFVKTPSLQGLPRSVTSDSAGFGHVTRNGEVAEQISLEQAAAIKAALGFGEGVAPIFGNTRYLGRTT